MRVFPRLLRSRTLDREGGQLLLQPRGRGVRISKVAKEREGTNDQSAFALRDSRRRSRSRAKILWRRLRLDISGVRRWPDDRFLPDQRCGGRSARATRSDAIAQIQSRAAAGNRVRVL